MISDEAVEAAEEYLSLLMADPNGDYTVEARDLLRSAAPHVISAHLLTLAEDTRARGDIGKDGGCEAWDYLTFHAEKAINNVYRSQP